jgi:peroxiredoxin
MKYMIIIIALLGFLLSTAGDKLKSQPLYAPVTGLEVGKNAPNIILPDTTGELLNLADQRGNLVLVTFWASWCRPCRHENKALADIYRQFKDKKFNNAHQFKIFSVSLDRNKDNWLKAIENDGMIWKEHVSNLQGWNSPAADVYDVRAIPAAFLLDKNGVIIAKNPKLDQLAEILKQLSN